MKLFAMKLNSLLLFLGAIYIVGLRFDYPLMESSHGNLLAAVDQFPWAVRFSLLAIGIIIALLGLYGLLPSFRGGKNRIITYRDGQGDVMIKLAPLQATLNRVVNNMPEVKKIQAEVLPDDNDQKAFIDASLTLQGQPGMVAREAVDTVRWYIWETAKNTLGLDVTNVRISLDGINVDVRAASKSLKEQMRKREEAETFADVPDAAVTVVPLPEEPEPVRMEVEEAAAIMEDTVVDAVEETPEVTAEDSGDDFIAETPETEEEEEEEPVWRPTEPAGESTTSSFDSVEEEASPEEDSDENEGKKDQWSF